MCANQFDKNKAQRVATAFSTLIQRSNAASMEKSG